MDPNLDYTTARLRECVQRGMTISRPTCKPIARAIWVWISTSCAPVADSAAARNRSSLAVGLLKSHSASIVDSLCSARLSSPNSAASTIGRKLAKAADRRIRSGPPLVITPDFADRLPNRSPGRGMRIAIGRVDQVGAIRVSRLIVRNFAESSSGSPSRLRCASKALELGYL